MTIFRFTINPWLSCVKIACFQPNCYRPSIIPCVLQLNVCENSLMQLCVKPIALSKGSTTFTSQYCCPINPCTNNVMNAKFFFWMSLIFFFSPAASLTVATWSNAWATEWHAFTVQMGWLKWPQTRELTLMEARRSDSMRQSSSIPVCWLLWQSVH